MIDELIKESGLERRVSEVINEVRDSKNPIDALIKFYLDAKDKHQDLSREESKEEIVYKFALVRLLNKENYNSFYGIKDRGYSNAS